MSFIIDGIKYSEEQSHPRQCDECGEGMDEGWCDGELVWCSNKCLKGYNEDVYSDEQKQKDIDNGILDYTEWERDDVSERPYWHILVKEREYING